ncbi:hypothetical protein [Haladaptatus halobius]|uniref:hypothetical protein n=1 Tax=Haladaptatus halobius TaxID=2884875 RepID=UPI001D0B600E|nr:hypothetical protein [Haladaptatus halobius]
MDAIVRGLGDSMPADVHGELQGARLSDEGTDEFDDLRRAVETRAGGCYRSRVALRDRRRGLGMLRDKVGDNA